MRAWLRSPWTIGVTVMLVLLVIVAGYWFRWDWTGFPTKTLWDWLQLLGVLAIPVAVGFGTVWFTAKQAQVSNEENKDNQREAALLAYIDKISELLLHEHLGEPSPDPQVENIAQARTTTALHTLDPIRRGSLIQFLSKAGILAICVEHSVKSSFESPLNNEYSLAEIDLNAINLNGVNFSNLCLEKANLQKSSLKQANLQGTDLSGANLQGANLMFAELQKANLTGANLQGAKLYGADLQGANLMGANLEKANLHDANLKGAGCTVDKQLSKAFSLQGTIMPDGSTHP